MANVRWICLDSDDLMHENSGEENYNESAYYNFYDPACRLGGFVRIGNRPNERYAEMTICLYLPDGRVAFMFKRPEIADNSAFRAAGMAFDVRVPMREHAIHYDGSCVMLARPLELSDPGRAFRENPHRPVSLELTYEALSPAHGGEPREQRGDAWVSVRTEKAGQEFARGHLEQHGHARGRVTVDGVDWAIDGYGLRDHSWGPRYWQAPKCYRWLTMNFGPDHGVAGALTTQRDGREICGGYVYERGRPNRPIGRVEVETERAGEQDLHANLHATLHPADGGPPERVDGRVLAMVPLRNRRAGVTTRIAEGLTEWRWGQRIGYGWSEYLDHLD